MFQVQITFNTLHHISCLSLCTQDSSGMKKLGFQQLNIFFQNIGKRNYAQRVGISFHCCFILDFKYSFVTSVLTLNSYPVENNCV